VNRLQNLSSEVKRELAGTALGQTEKRALNNFVDKVQKEIDYTQQNVKPTGIQKGEMRVRWPGEVRVPLKWAVASADYKITCTLLTRDPETSTLSEAVVTPLYDKRRKDSFYVNCSMPGSLKWEIKPF